MRCLSRWNYGFPGSKLRSRLSMTFWMLLSWSVPICGEDVEVVERFTYLGSDIHVSAGCESEVNRRLGRAWGVMDSLDHGVWRCRYLCGRTKVRVVMSLMLPVLLYGCETWTLTKDLRWRLNSFGTRSLRRILGYRWSDFVSNERLLRDSDDICYLHSP